MENVNRTSWSTASWAPEVVLTLLPILYFMKLKRDVYISYGIFDIGCDYNLSKWVFQDGIRGYWLYESVILLVLALRGCKGKKRITVGSARLRSGLLTDRPKEICERICQRVPRRTGTRKGCWSTTGRFGGDLGFNWNLKLAQCDLSIGCERWRWRPDLRAWVGAKVRQSYRASQPAPSSLS